MESCAKCGRADFNIQYIANVNTRYGVCTYETVGNKGKFVEYIDFQSTGKHYSIKKEHLYCTCNTCGYKWLKDTIDNTK